MVWTLTHPHFVVYGVLARENSLTRFFKVGAESGYHSIILFSLFIIANADDHHHDYHHMVGSMGLGLKLLEQSRKGAFHIAPYSNQVAELVFHGQF